MKFSVLASGSTGNAIYVETEEARLLIDAGLSGKRIEQLMSEVDIDPTSLDALLVTHEHADHIKGLGIMARRYNLPIFANGPTWDVLPPLIGEVNEAQKQIFETGAVKQFGNLTVESFGISHDAAEPMGFCFYEGDLKLSLTTDTGYVSEKVKAKISGSDVMIFESNHDVEMLRMGSYPWSIKRRILSDYGHLSNEMAGDALIDIMNGDTDRVYLAHLSKDNNIPQLAHLTVKNILEEHGITEGKDITLFETYPDKPTAMYEIKKKGSLIGT